MAKLGIGWKAARRKQLWKLNGLEQRLEKTKHKPDSRNNPGRQHRKKGHTKEKARQAYTKKNVRKTYCKNDSVAGCSQFQKRFQKSVVDPMMAYEKLKEFVFSCMYQGDV